MKCRCFLTLWIFLLSSILVCGQEEDEILSGKVLRYENVGISSDPHVSVRSSMFRECLVTLYSGSDTLSTKLIPGGSFIFRGLKRGEVRLTAEYKGYIPFDEVFPLNDKKNVILIEMHKDKDLLKQMPGVKYDSSGSIRVYGQSITRTYVNNALIFGTNHMAAMNNLKADQVVSMEVYDEENPFEKEKSKVSYFQKLINI